MASFVYFAYIQGLQAGFANPPSAWSNFFLALVEGSYVPDQATDAVLGDIPGGSIAADGKTGTFPVLTVAFAPTTPSSIDVAGLKAAIAAAPNDRWGAVPAGPDVVACVLYGNDGGTFRLIAYYDDWSGLPFTPDGSDVPLVSLPTPLAAGGDNLVLMATP